MMKKNKIYYLLMLLAITAFSSCDKDDDIYPQLGDDPRNIAEIVSETGNLSTFAQALNQTTVDSLLRTTTTYTVFAPNNAAFDGVDTSTLSDEELENLLLNHIINTVTADFSHTLSSGYLTTMATGPNETNLSFYINMEEEARFNGMASFVNGSYDIGATNGVLHVVDGVLAPPNIVDHVNANPEFSMLAEAIELAQLSETLSANNTENEDSPFTLFAPTNAAFESIMAQLNGAFGWQTLSDVPVDVLQEIITYHIIAGENTLSTEVPETEPASMQGDVISINEDSVIGDASETDANITLTDIQGVNGIVHGIDKVLLPENVYQDILASTLNIVEQSENRGYSTFLAAIEMLGMTTTLSNDDLTVFAPNNDAFTALFAQAGNYGSLDDFETEEQLGVLESLINYHLHSGTLLTSQFTNNGTVSTINGDDITTDLSGDNIRLIPTFDEAIPSQIVNANIGATNGVIHEINRVLVPASLVSSLGIATEAGGLCPVGDPSMVFFDWDENSPWWGNVTAENDPSLSIDGSSYGRANFQTGGTGFIDLFWRNDPSTFNGAQVVGANLDQYSLKFDINVMEPISDGRFRFRFNSTSGVDAFYDWAPWEETGEPFTTDGWETIEIPLSVLGVPDFSLVDAEFGMAFQDADIFLDFAIDNVRFDTPGCGNGPDPIEDEDLIFFDWDGNDPYWGNIGAENDPSISLDGSNYGRADFQTGGTGWVDLFWRNGGTLNGGDVVGTNINDYVLKFDIYTLEPISDGMFRIRFNNTSGVDAFYDWAPWDETGEAFDTGGGWTTVSIPVSVLGQPDFSQVDAEFGMAFEGADVYLDFAIDNVRFEEL